MERIGEHAIVFLPWNSIESEAQQQIMNTARMPFVFKHVAVMPDCHYGKGATVGTVLPTDGAIIPAAVGVDIGCGMIAVRTPLNRPGRHRASHSDERRQVQHHAHEERRRQGRNAPATGEGAARDTRQIRFEMASVARHARRRESLH